MYIYIIYVYIYLRILCLCVYTCISDVDTSLTFLCGWWLRRRHRRRAGRYALGGVSAAALENSRRIPSIGAAIRRCCGSTASRPQVI